MHLGGVSLTFMQEKINLCTPIEYPMEWGGRVSIKYASQRGGSGGFEHGLSSFALALSCTSK